MARRRHKESNTKTILIGIFVVFIMVASSLAYVMTSYGSKNKELDYNGFDFEIDYQNSKYIVKVDRLKYSFDSHPAELENYIFSEESRSLMMGSEVIFVLFNPELDPSLLAYIDRFRLDLAQQTAIPVLGAVTKESANYAFPVMSCDNPTQGAFIISIEDSYEPNILNQGSCIVVQGRGYEVLRIKERIIYGLLGVMNG